MSDPIDPDTLDSCDAAAYWFARERSGRMDEAERQRFEAWLEADPRHGLEYRRAMGIWNASTLIPAERLRALASEPAPTHKAANAQAHPFFQRRRLAAGLALACVAAVALAAANPSWWQGRPNYQTALSTKRGEQRQITLPDDSVIALNTATALTVRFYEDTRIVDLESGEATFIVAANAQRPFYVKADDVTVRVTGTRFNVRRDAGNKVQVAVESGSVAVQQGPWWKRNALDLSAGQIVDASEQGGVALTDGMDVATVMAWRQGRVVFRNTRLADAIAEFNRYASQQVKLDPQGLADVRIAGAFSTQAPESFLALLPDIAPVTVRYLMNGTPVVMRR